MDLFYTNYWAIRIIIIIITKPSAKSNSGRGGGKIDKSLKVGMSHCQQTVEQQNCMQVCTNTAIRWATESSIVISMLVILLPRSLEKRRAEEFNTPKADQ